MIFTHNANFLSFPTWINAFDTHYTNISCINKSTMKISSLTRITSCETLQAMASKTTLDLPYCLEMIESLMFFSLIFKWDKNILPFPTPKCLHPLLTSLPNLTIIFFHQPSRPRSIYRNPASFIT